MNLAPLRWRKWGGSHERISAITILIGIIVALVVWFALLATFKPERVIASLEQWTAFWIKRAPSAFIPKRTIPGDVRAARRSMALGIFRLGGVFCLIWVAIFLLILINA